MLSIQQLTAGYYATPVLRDFSLTVEDGTVAAIIGPNGCGKSTLLRCIAGLLAPRNGQVEIDGADISTLDERTRARKVAMLPQHFEGGEELTVEAMVALGRTPYLPPYGSLGSTDREVVERCMAMSFVDTLRTRQVGTLSGGERQRVMLARALAQQPCVLLLDEPASNLDIRYQHEIVALILKLARIEKLAVILVLHQINLAAAAADRLVLLNGSGDIRAQGTPRAVMTRENLEAVYNMPLQVALHPVSGRPQAQSAWEFPLSADAS